MSSSPRSVEERVSFFDSLSTDAAACIGRKLVEGPLNRGVTHIHSLKPVANLLFRPSVLSRAVRDICKSIPNCPFVVSLQRNRARAVLNGLLCDGIWLSQSFPFLSEAVSQRDALAADQCDTPCTTDVVLELARGVRQNITELICCASTFVTLDCVGNGPLSLRLIVSNYFAPM